MNAATTFPRGATAEIVPLVAIPARWEVAWADLAADAAEPNPFAENWFMRPAIAHLSPPGDARMLAVWDGGRLLGLLPLIDEARYARLPLTHAVNWLHYHAFLGTPLVRAYHEGEFWRTALAALDDAPDTNLLHLTCLTADGPVLRALANVRRADIVHRAERAMLTHGLSPAAYYETNVRKKKRKEIGRLRSRLAELGAVACERDGPVDAWTDEFLALEAAGWKGRAGSALADDPATRAFFREALAGAVAAGKLEILRLSLDGRAIAMLVNFLTPPGGFSFKIAFDEDYARFSPGVLIQLENLTILDCADIAWMDSCAVEDHSMINSLWAERREIVRVTVPLNGARRRAAFTAARSLERASAAARRLSGARP